MNAIEGPRFVDTNVLVYAYDASAGAKHEQARALAAGLWNSGNGRLSVQVLQEFYVTVTQKIARPLLSTAAAEIIADLGTWETYSPVTEDVRSAIQLQTRYQISFWDAMIVAGARGLGCDVISSEDLNAGQVYGGVTVIDPFSGDYKQ